MNILITGIHGFVGFNTDYNSLQFVISDNNFNGCKIPIQIGRNIKGIKCLNNASKIV